MSINKSPYFVEHFKVEKLKDWPEPNTVASMEELAREDIDEAVHAILFREKYVVKRLDTYIKALDTLKERKKELLHKKWTENVAFPLQESIVKKVLSYRGLRKKKEEDFEQFLSHTRKKPNLFGELYDPQEYDPYSLKVKHPSYGKVTVPALYDPLFQSQRRKDEERRITLQFDTERPSTSQELKEIEKTKQCSGLPQCLFSLYEVTPKDLHKDQTSQRSERGKRQMNSSPKELHMDSSELLDEKTRAERSQAAFERSFQASRLSPGRRRPDRRDMVWGSNWARPRSSVVPETQHLEPLGRQVMTSEALGQHLATLRLRQEPKGQQPIKIP